jgi:RNA polymerase sigma-70 factor (ECF subfamily)
MFLFKNKYKKLTDEELIIAIRKNKSDKYAGVLFERYAHLVFGVCLKYLRNEFDSKDCVLEVFEKALPYLQNNEVTNIKSWIFTNAKNHCLMLIRSRKTIQKNHEKYKVIDHKNEYNPQKEKQLQLLEKEIENLSEQQKSCIKLFYLEQKSYAEIVDLTGFELKKVKSYIQNAKRNLKLTLETQDEFSI